MTNKMFSVEVNRSYDVTNQEWNNEIYLKLYLNAFKSGLVAKLGTEKFTTLLAIASYMDENGSCYPTQEQIGERIGVSRKTAGKYINDLLEERIDGKPLIVREKKRNPAISPNEFSVYTVLPLSQVAIFNGTIEPVGKVDALTKGKNDSSLREPAMGKGVPTNKNHIKQEPLNNNQLEHDNEIEEAPTNTVVFNNAKDVLTFWASKYRETYGVNCSINWKREVPMIKNKIIKTYTVSQIEQIILTIFQEYDSRWANNSYPRPTVGQLCSWLADKALAVADQVEAEKQAFENAQNVDVIDEDELMKKFGGGN
jgi:hypothetical protein